MASSQSVTATTRPDAASSSSVKATRTLSPVKAPCTGVVANCHIGAASKASSQRARRPVGTRPVSAARSTSAMMR